MYPYRDRDARVDMRGRLGIVVSVIESIEVRRTRPRTRWTPTDALSNTVSCREDEPGAVGELREGVGCGPVRGRGFELGVLVRGRVRSVVGPTTSAETYHARCSRGKPDACQRYISVA